ncbi:MAG TPA: hypothetical protein VFE77_03015 [Rhodanobacter sp.]|nr:hypothetical protein [Rhodanobacter sp.]
MAVQSTSVTTAIATVPFAVSPGEQVTAGLSGTYAMTVVLEESINEDPNGAFQPVGESPSIYSTANATVSHVHTVDGPPVGSGAGTTRWMRWRFTSVTSGTCVATMTNGATPLQAPDIVLNRNVSVTGDFHTGAESGSVAPVAGGAALTLTAALHAGKTINFDTAAGTIITLPAATGTMDVYKFVVTVVPTSNDHHVLTAPSTDHLRGTALLNDSATVTGYDAYAVSTHTANKILMNGTTTGALSIGDSFELQDIGAGWWQVRNFVANASGSAATPFVHV